MGKDNEAQMGCGSRYLVAAVREQRTPGRCATGRVRWDPAHPWENSPVGWPQLAKTPDGRWAGTDPEGACLC
jgi:hypothetical protein